MKVSKNINHREVRKLLESVVNDNNLSLNKRIELYRFIDKLSDSESYESIVNKEFSAFKLSNKKDDIINKINHREVVILPCEFELRPYQITNWELYLCDELFLESFDKKIATRIALDINVAFSIKYARINKQNQETI